MSGTVPPPPPPPGPDDRPAAVPPRPAGVRRVASAYQRPPAIDPNGAGPQEQYEQAAHPQATFQHAPIPPAPEQAAPTAPQQAAYAPVHQQAAYAPVHQPTQQIPPAAQAPAWTAQPAYAQPAYAPADGYGGGYEPPAPAPVAAAPAGEPAPRRRLSAGWIAFIVVDVVLIVMAVAFAVQIFTSSSPEPGDVAAGGAPSATASSEAPAAPETLARFAAPSKNITCTITTETATCGIAELNQQPAPVDECDGTKGYVVSVDAQGEIALPCVPPSEQPKRAGKKIDVLDYGKSVTEGDFTCTSAESGMSCRYDPSGQGFSIARAGVGTS